MELKIKINMDTYFSFNQVNHLALKNNTRPRCKNLNKVQNVWQLFVLNGDTRTEAVDLVGAQLSDNSC